MKDLGAKIKVWDPKLRDLGAPQPKVKDLGAKSKVWDLKYPRDKEGGPV